MMNDSSILNESLNQKPKKIIEVKGVYKIYNDLKAINNVSFDVYDGEIFGIIGPNGAGKTTLVECIEGLKTPSKGNIKILGLDIIKGGEKTKQRLRKHIGIQLQESKLPDRITVLESLELFASFYDKSVSINSLLKHMGLIKKKNSYFETLSGGQKQRLFIALSLINNPKIIFFDELTTGLDPHSRRTMWDMVNKIRAKKKTVILVTHFMEEAEQLCDRVAIIDHGRFIALDTPTNLINGLNISAQVSFITTDHSIIDKINLLDGINKIEKIKGEIIVDCTDKWQIVPVITTLLESDIEFQNLSIKNPTLEDVFLDLTGRKIRE